jgi:hypothetical protein
MSSRKAGRGRQAEEGQAGTVAEAGACSSLLSTCSLHALFMLPVCFFMLFYMLPQMILTCLRMEASAVRFTAFLRVAEGSSSAGKERKLRAIAA